MFTLFVVLIALVLGIVMPLRWGVFGFVGVSLLLFILQAAVKTSAGFSGSSIEDSLVLFNGSWASYIGFNIQLTYRTFTPVLLALSIPLIFRLSRAAS